MSASHSHPPFSVVEQTHSGEKSTAALPDQTDMQKAFHKCSINTGRRLLSRKGITPLSWKTDLRISGITLCKANRQCCKHIKRVVFRQADVSRFGSFLTCFTRCRASLGCRCARPHSSAIQPLDIPPFWPFSQNLQFRLDSRTHNSGN